MVQQGWAQPSQTSKLFVPLYRINSTKTGYLLLDMQSATNVKSLRARPVIKWRKGVLVRQQQKMDEDPDLEGWCSLV